MTWLTWICVGYVIGFGVTLLAFAIPKRIHGKPKR